MANQLLDSARNATTRVLALIEKKNGDYASVGDPYQNFKASRVLGLTVEKALLVRAFDKMVRVDNLCSHDSYVTEESLEDSIDDVIGYMLILRAYRESLRPAVE